MIAPASLQYCTDEAGKACIDDAEKQRNDRYDNQYHRCRSQGLLSGWPRHLFEFHLDLAKELDGLVKNVFFFGDRWLAYRRIGFFNSRLRTGRSIGQIPFSADPIRGLRFLLFLLGSFFRSNRPIVPRFFSTVSSWSLFQPSIATAATDST